MNKASHWFLLCAVLLVPQAAIAQSDVIFSEDFEGLDLGPFVDEELTEIPQIDPSAVWTKTPPEGWSVDDEGMPGGGVLDWRGWSFANANAWAFVAGDQDRTLFTKASGTVAVADPDEWDDAERDDGFFFSLLNSQEVSLSGVDTSNLTLTFDSSWRPEDSQTVELLAHYSDGSNEILMTWSSIEGDPFFHDDNVNETVTLELNVPDGADSVFFEFAMFEAGNDWWWAIDNVALNAGAETIWSEDFEGLPLESFQMENLPDDIQTLDPNTVWTNTPPQDWNIDNSAMPGGGVTEWQGWSFANKQAWATVAGDQGRFEFTKGTGTVAIADPDEWDDLEREEGFMVSTLSTPEISLEGFDASSPVNLTFDSSWRPEDTQSARLDVTYSDGSTENLFTWLSIEGDPNFHDDNTNETVSIDLAVPSGATSLTLDFTIFDATNDWWWAIDNLVVTGESLQTGIDAWSLF